MSKTNTITFYADLRSQPCRAVYLFMKLNKIPFKMEKVDIAKGEQLGEKFTALCGLQTVPVIEDNGFALGESCAILRYLAKKFSVPDHWYPTNDSRKQARLEEYLYWHSSNTRQNAVRTFRHQFMPLIKGEQVNQDEVTEYKTALAKTLGRIESYFLKEQPFILGTEISVADLQALCELMQLDLVRDENLYLSNPKIKEWIDRVKAVAGPHLEDCLKQGFYEIRERYDKLTTENLGDEFTKISSIQRVPVLDDNGFILGESGAIFRYLSQKFGVEEHWYPSKDLQQQARIDEYLNWHHTNIRIPTMMTFRHQYINTVRGRPIKQNEVKRHKTDLAKSVKHIDTYFLKGNPYIAGKDISVADLQAYCELMQLDIIGNENEYRCNPNVRAWVDRVKARVQPYFEQCQTEGVSPMKSMYDQLKSSKL